MLENEFDISKLDVIEPIEENDLSESPYEKDSRMPRDTSSYPPFGNFPGPNFPGPNYPGPNLPNPNYPNGGFDPNINNPSIQAPPKNAPNKNDPQVKSLNSNSPQGNLKAVSPNSISICLYQNTYIWEQSGRSYWMFITYLDNRTASGFRWFGNRWGYFGIDLKRIDSFVCYRDVSSETTSDNQSSNKNLFNLERKEYLKTITRDVYTRSISINKLEKSNNVYNLELSIPETVDEFNKTLIFSYANSLVDKYFNSSRADLNENIDEYIMDIIQDFSCDFEIKLYNLQLSNSQLRNIKYNINNIIQ